MGVWREFDRKATRFVQNVVAQLRSLNEKLMPDSGGIEAVPTGFVGHSILGATAIRLEGCDM